MTHIHFAVNFVILMGTNGLNALSRLKKTVYLRGLNANGYQIHTQQENSSTYKQGHSELNWTSRCFNDSLGCFDKGVSRGCYCISLFDVIQAEHSGKNKLDFFFNYYFFFSCRDKPTDSHW